MQLPTAKNLLQGTEYYRKRTAAKPKSQCPMEGCNAVVVRVTDHLKRCQYKQNKSIVPGGEEELEIMTGTQSEEEFQNPHEKDDSSQQSIETQDNVRENSTHFQLDEILESFSKHMSGIDGGLKARPESYVLGVKQIITAAAGLSGGSVDLSCLTRANVKVLYIQPFLSENVQSNRTGLSVKTVRNKLKSLEYFSKYLIGENDVASLITSCNRDELQKLIESLPSWRQSLRRKCSMEEVQRRVQDTRESISANDIARYRSSTYAKQATCLLMNTSNTFVPTQYDFTKSRNHMITLISISNAHRTGVLCNLTVADYQNGIKQHQGPNEDTVFHVAKHKTASSHGVATLAINREEAQLLEGYFRIRNSANLPGVEPYLFLNTTGTKMTQSNIANALTTAFNQSGYSERVNCTKLRKAAVTTIHKKFPDKASELADHMLHRLATAAKHYRINDKENKFSFLCEPSTI